MSFELFTAGRRQTKDPRVTIIKSGVFNFNCGTVKIFSDNAVTYLQVFFDKETNRIAFKPSTKSADGAYIIRIKKGIGQISGTSFLKNYKIRYEDQTRSYPAVWNTEQNMLIISLN